jgi:hypothetical protein
MLSMVSANSPCETRDVIIMPSFQISSFITSGDGSDDSPRTQTVPPPCGLDATSHRVYYSGKIFCVTDRFKSYVVHLHLLSAP